MSMAVALVLLAVALAVGVGSVWWSIRSPGSGKDGL